MIDANYVVELLKEVENELFKINKDILLRFPIQKYMKILDQYPKVGNYHYVSPKMEAFCKAIVLEVGDKGMALYNQIVLIKMILVADEKLQNKIMPCDISGLYEKQFRRILLDINANDKLRNFYEYQEDKFLKDQSLCHLRMIPVGGRKMHLSKIPKNFLFACGLKSFLKGFKVFIVELKGGGLFYQTHLDSMDPDVMSEFTPDGHRRTHWRIAQVMKIQKNVKGVFGKCWFFDPKLEKISPRLAYLRQVFLEGGVHFFNVGTSTHAIIDATSRSPTRKRLYEEGKYTPVEYFWVWPRENLIEWADRQDIHLPDEN